MPGLNIAALPPLPSSPVTLRIVGLFRVGRAGICLPLFEIRTGDISTSVCVQFISNERYYSIPRVRSRSISRSLKFVINLREIPLDGTNFFFFFFAIAFVISPWNNYSSCFFLFSFFLVSVTIFNVFHLYQFSKFNKTSNNSSKDPSDESCFFKKKENSNIHYHRRNLHQRDNKRMQTMNIFYF